MAPAASRSGSPGRSDCGIALRPHRRGHAGSGVPPPQPLWTLRPAWLRPQARHALAPPCLPSDGDERGTSGGPRRMLAKRRVPPGHGSSLHARTGRRGASRDPPSAREGGHDPWPRVQSRGTAATGSGRGVAPEDAGSATDPSAELMRLINGYQVSQALHVAATLGVADQLKDGPQAERRPGPGLRRASAVALPAAAGPGRGRRLPRDRGPAVLAHAARPLPDGRRAGLAARLRPLDRHARPVAALGRPAPQRPVRGERHPLHLGRGRLDLPRAAPRGAGRVRRRDDGPLARRGRGGDRGLRLRPVRLRRGRRRRRGPPAEGDPARLPRRARGPVRPAAGRRGGGAGARLGRAGAALPGRRRGLLPSPSPGAATPT